MPKHYPEQPSAPVIQPPGTQGAPQETPNQFKSIPALLPRQQCQPAFCPTECPTGSWECPQVKPQTVPEPQVLAAEVVVRSPEGELSEELRNAAHRHLHCPGRTTTRSQLQEDINAIFATGFSQMSAAGGSLGVW